MLNILKRSYLPKNIAAKRFYDGNEKIKDLGISLPEPINSLTIGTPWVSVAVDSLNGKIKFQGFAGKDEETATRISVENQLGLKAHAAHRDALIYGTCYLQAGYGNTELGEPKVMITAESPMHAYGEISPITRTMEEYIKVYEKDHSSIEVLYMSRDKVIHIELSMDSSDDSDDNVWDILESCKSIAMEEKITLTTKSNDSNTLGYIPVVKMVNKPDSTLTKGQSEITTSMKQICADAIRAHASIVSMRESFSIPRAFLLGMLLDKYNQTGHVNQDDITYMNDMIQGGGFEVPDINAPGGIIAVGPTPVGDDKYITPELKQLQPGSVDGYIEQLRWYASLMSGATSIPVSMLGGPVTSNPPSAESLAASLSALSEKASLRSKAFGLAWSQVMLFAMKMYGVEEPELLRVKWGSPSQSVTSSASQADSVSKLVAAGVYDARSRAVYELLGLSEEEIEVQMTQSTAQLVEQIEKVTNQPTIDEMPPIEPQVDETLREAQQYYQKYLDKLTEME